LRNQNINVARKEPKINFDAQQHRKLAIQPDEALNMSNQQQIHNVAFEEACGFIIKLGKDAHSYGSTTGNLEKSLSSITQSFGFHGSFQITPGEIIFAFQEDESHPQRIHLTNLPFCGLDLDKLAKVGDLMDAVIGGSISLTEANNQLDEIRKDPLPWGQFANALSYIACGSGIAILFSGSWWDTFFAGFFSLVVYMMIIVSGRFGQRAAEWLPLYTAFVAAALTAITKHFIPEINLVLVVVSAIIILLPGYGISLGVAQLVSQQTVSGGANLMNGLVYLAKQFCGAWLGATLIISLLPVTSAAAGTPVSSNWLWLFMPLIIASLCIAFQTSNRDFFWAALGCAIAYGGILLGGAVLDGNLGNLFGTIVAVVYANLWTRKTSRPISIVLLPAIVLLVSGSIGFRGLAAMASGQVAIGEQQFMQMFIVALTIAAGLLIGNTIVKPQASL